MAKKSRTQDTAADFARRSNAVSRMNSPRLSQPQRAALVGRDVSPRPMPRPSRGPEESMRPVTRPDDLAERAELRKAMDSSDAAYRASRREAADIDMQGFAEGGQVSTRRMPSGAQQYTRGETDSDRLMTNSRAFSSALRSNLPAADQITRAMADEFALSNAARRNETQAEGEDVPRRRTQKFAEGGMVRGCKAAQMTGKKFSGTF